MTHERLALQRLVAATQIQRGYEQVMNGHVPYTKCPICGAGDWYQHIPDEQVVHNADCALKLAIEVLSPSQAHMSVSPSPLAQAIMDRVDGTNLGMFITSAR